MRIELKWFLIFDYNLASLEAMPSNDSSGQLTVNSDENHSVEEDVNNGWELVGEYASDIDYSLRNRKYILL